MAAADFQVEANLDAGETLNKKIRNAQLAHYNFILGNSCKFTFITNFFFTVLLTFRQTLTFLISLYYYIHVYYYYIWPDILYLEYKHSVNSQEIKKKAKDDILCLTYFFILKLEN